MGQKPYHFFVLEFRTFVENLGAKNYHH